MKTLILTLSLLLASLPQAVNVYANCGNSLEKCAKSNPGSMAGFTLVDAAYEDLDTKGGKMKITLHAGNTYRFLACPPNDNVSLVLVLQDGKGNIIAHNMTEDQEGVFKMMEVNCTSTAEYMLVLLPFRGTGCCGVIYAMK